MLSENNDIKEAPPINCPVYGEKKRKIEPISGTKEGDKIEEDDKGKGNIPQKKDGSDSESSEKQNNINNTGNGEFIDTVA